MNRKHLISSTIHSYITQTFKKQLSPRQFKTMFGITLKLCEYLIYHTLCCLDDEYSTEVKNYAKYSLWTLYYLKNHNNQDVCSLMFRTSKSTYIRHVHKQIKLLSRFDFVAFDSRLKNASSVVINSKIIHSAVDTTDVPCVYYSNWGKERRRVFSVKNHQYSVKFEVAVTLDGLIVWYHGPFFHDWPDIKIARDALLKQLEQNEAVLGDKGYIGDARCVTPFKQPRNRPLMTLKKNSTGRLVLIEQLLKILMQI